MTVRGRNLLSTSLSHHHKIVSHLLQYDFLKSWSFHGWSEKLDIPNTKSQICVPLFLAFLFCSTDLFVHSSVILFFTFCFCHYYFCNLSNTLPPEKAVAPHSSTFAWKLPWTEEPGGLQSMRSRRVRHDWATSLSLFTFMHWRRKWQPTPVFLPGESQGRGSLVGCHLWGPAESDRTEAT